MSEGSGCQPNSNPSISRHAGCPFNGRTGELQAQDPELAPIVRLQLQQSDQPSFDVVRTESAETKFYWSQWTRLIVRDGVVFRVIFDRQGRPCGQQLLVPKVLRNELIEMVHAGLTGCHVGVGKTRSVEEPGGGVGRLTSVSSTSGVPDAVGISEAGYLDRELCSLQG